jgi:hypothetical protein
VTSTLLREWKHRRPSSHTPSQTLAAWRPTASSPPPSPRSTRSTSRRPSAKDEVDQIICWLTGYDRAGLQKQIAAEAEFATFFGEAPALHPNTALIKGVVCGVRVEAVEDPLMRKIRWLDKLVDELAKGKAMEKILR